MCKIYEGMMVYVPRAQVLVDVFRELPAQRRAELRGSERKLIEYLD